MCVSGGGGYVCVCVWGCLEVVDDGEVMCVCVCVEGGGGGLP